MKKGLRALIAAVTAAITVSAFAVTQDGSVDSAASSGTVDINLNITPAIVISGLTTIDLSADAASTSGDLTGSDTFCVASIGFSNYEVTLTSGTAGAGTYELAGTSQNLPYSVEYTSDTALDTGDAPNGTGIVEPAAPYVPAQGLTCSADNAKLIVNVAESQWLSATEQSYTDTLTIQVSGQ
ncbi:MULTISPECIES: hypothetical protein [unclassified Microbulbifer]|uniref:hypothetical protein n=1 Tax=unclassified Microbulbifer TaxID=2619833 RepID=UPI001E34043D|nr:hypothetical protein [Microbulbifer sp. YPW16]UHQ54769.1 hypothetical protein LVE68_14855 [Microbulbifer sp. YPW16]